MQAQDLALARRHKLLLRLYIFLKKKSAAAARRALIRIRENEVAIIAIAAAAGFVVGAGVAAIGSAAALLHHILFGVPPGSHASAGAAIPTISAFLAPAIGGMLVGLTAAIIRYLRPHEIVDPIEANALYGGRMSMWDSLNLTLITVISVSFGGSAGLEAAYTQAGSGFASKTGQAFRLRRRDLRLLVGCGSAAAISAAFNSPLTGAFYAFELVIGSYTLQSLAPVASAALCGNLAMHAIAGAEPLFEMPGTVALGGRDYVLFLFLGLGAALVSIVAMRAVTLVENSLRHRKVPRWLRPALGGLAVGAIAAFYPEVLGSGHGEISYVLGGGFSMEPLTLLLIAKIAASAFTVGSGMRGGLFSSSLLLGTLFGAATAAALHALALGLEVNAVAYALAGMGAVAAGIVGAPITMTLLVLETTGNFSLTIGVMTAVIACSVVVRQSFGYSFATWRFHVRGLRIRGAHDVGWIADLTVAKVMRRDIHLVPASETVAELRAHFPLGGPKYAFVCDEGGAYLGTIETIEAHSPAYDGTAEQTPASELIHGEPRVLTPGENIHTALAVFAKTESEVIPVVETVQNGRVLGCVSEAYLWKRYSQELEKHRIDETNGGVFGPESSGI
jgi:chloride channel protein, CIC family